MESVFKKVLAAFLVVIIAAASMSAFLAPLEVSAASSMTENEFAEKISILKSRYPHGQYWNEYNGTETIAGQTVAKAGKIGCNGTRTESGEKCTSKGFCYNCTCKCGYFYGWQCFGFANLMAYHIFGSYATTGYNKGDVNSSKGWMYKTSVSTYYAGDIVRINNNHSIFVYKVTDSEVFYVDCNWGVPCQINWNRTMTIDKLKSSTTFVVRMEGNTLKGTGSSSAGSLTINYHANGGYIASDEDRFYLSSSIVYDGNTSSPACRVWQYGETHKDGLHNYTTFSLCRDGYTFLGWSLSPDGGTVIDQDAVITPESIVPEIKNESKTVTMYAIWKANVDNPGESGESSTYNWLFPVNNGSGKVAYVYGYSSKYFDGTVFHTGIDIHTSGDQVIYAAFSGIVTKVSNSCEHVNYGKKCEHNDDYGNSIRIKGDDGLIAIYGHLKQNSILVKEGAYVEKGQPIGTMGSSGWSSGKHLHFEVRNKNNNSINVNSTSSATNPGVVSYTITGYNPIVSDPIAEGAYKFSNDGYRIYMVSDKAAKGTLKVSDSAVDSKFDFTIVKDGNYYRIYPTSGGKYYFNAYWTDSQTTHTLHGSEVTLWGNDTSDYSQKWIFEQYGDGYLIHPACTPGFSLTRDGDRIVVKQTTNSDNQIWHLETDMSVPQEHQFGDWYVEYDATCTDDGLEYRECSICGQREERIISANGHEFGDWYVYEEPTCSSPGCEDRDCKYCDEYECREIPALDHDFGDWYVYEEPTCSEPGYEDRDCMNCDEYERREIPALGEHSFSEWYVEYEPVCYEDGLEYRECDICGEREERDIPAFGYHSYGDWYTWREPTCTEDGIECRDCDVCGDCEECKIPAPGHEFGDWYVGEEPTCTAPGYEYRDCMHCYEYECREIPAHGEHSFGDWYIYYEPTCIDDGLEYRECYECEEYEERTVAATGIHEFEDWNIWYGATCTDVGLEYRSCKNCSEYEEREIPATGHIYGDWYISVDPTCTEKGNKERDCYNCDASESVEIDSFGGHRFGNWRVERNATCTEDGIEYRECTICWEYEEREIPALGEHDFSDWDVEYEATCVEDGLESRECDICGEREERIVPAHGMHIFDEWITTKEPTATEDGICESTCRNCDEKIMEVIPAFGEDTTPEDTTTEDTTAEDTTAEDTTAEETTAEETTAEETTAEETTAEETTAEETTAEETTAEETTEEQTDQESSASQNININCSGVIHCATASFFSILLFAAYVAFKKKQD